MKKSLLAVLAAVLSALMFLTTATAGSAGAVTSTSVLKVHPRNHLSEGQQVTLVGRHFSVNSDYDIKECLNTSVSVQDLTILSNCQELAIEIPPTPGNFRITVTVHDTINGTPCTTCVIGGMDEPFIYDLPFTWTKPLHFAHRKG